MGIDDMGIASLGAVSVVVAADEGAAPVPAPVTLGHGLKSEIDDVRRQLDLLASTRLVAPLDEQRQQFYESLCCRERELLHPPVERQPIGA